MLPVLVNTSLYGHSEQSVYVVEFADDESKDNADLARGDRYTWIVNLDLNSLKME